MSEGMLPEHADAVQVALDEARGLLVEGLSWQVEERSTEEDQGCGDFAHRAWRCSQRLWAAAYTWLPEVTPLVVDTHAGGAEAYLFGADLGAGPGSDVRVAPQRTREPGDTIRGTENGRIGAVGQ